MRKALVVLIACVALADGAYAGEHVWGIAGGSGANGLTFESDCSDPSTVTYPCIDASGYEWWRQGSSVPFPVRSDFPPQSTDLTGASSLFSAPSAEATLGVTNAWSVVSWIYLTRDVPTAINDRATIMHFRDTSGTANQSNLWFRLEGFSATGGYDCDGVADCVWNVRVEMNDTTPTECRDVVWQLQLPESDVKNTWHHVALVYDGAASVYTGLKLYWDGSEFPFEFKNASPTLSACTQQDDSRIVRIGNTSSNEELGGYMYYAGLTSEVLTAEKVAQIFAAGPRLDYRAFNFTHFWHMSPSVLDPTATLPDLGNGVTRDAVDSNISTWVTNIPAFPQTAPRGVGKITAFGDSNVHGGDLHNWTDEPSSESFLAFLTPGWDIHNHGVGGSECGADGTSPGDGVLSQVADWLAGSDAVSSDPEDPDDTDVVIIACGINDVLTANFASNAAIAADIQSSVDDLVAAGKTVVYITPVPPNSSESDAGRLANTGPLVDYLEANLTNVVFCNLYDFWLDYSDDERKPTGDGGSPGYFDNGVHMNHALGDPLAGQFVSQNCLPSLTPF